MTLPIVAGWMMDFRTAEDIFASGSNVRIAHCMSLCADGKLFTCHCEAPLFKSNAALKQAFIDHDCVVIPNDDVMQRCIGIAGLPLAKNRIGGNQSAIFITAMAAANSFGVISDPVFTTVYDLCDHFGIPIFSADEYFSELH
jgi:hypothetical protein